MVKGLSRDRSHYLLEQNFLRYGPNDDNITIINHGLRDAADIILHCHVIKLVRFNHFRLDHRIFHGYLVRKQHGSRAVGSGGGDEYFQE